MSYVRIEVRSCTTSGARSSYWTGRYNFRNAWRYTERCPGATLTDFLWGSHWEGLCYECHIYQLCKAEAMFSPQGTTPTVSFLSFVLFWNLRSQPLRDVSLHQSTGLGASRQVYAAGHRVDHVRRDLFPQHRSRQPQPNFFPAVAYRCLRETEHPGSHRRSGRRSSSGFHCTADTIGNATPLCHERRCLRAPSFVAPGYTAPSASSSTSLNSRMQDKPSRSFLRSSIPPLTDNSSSLSWSVPCNKTREVSPKRQGILIGYIKL